MLPGLLSAAAGLSAQQQQLDAIGNDIANASTPGYKAERVEFSDLLYSSSDIVSGEADVGAGARAQLAGFNPTQGPIKETGEPLDLAIEGTGFFELTRPNGAISLTRAGDFGVDAGGSIVASDGSQLVPPIKLPTGVVAGEVRIAPDGTVSAGAKKLGLIKLVSVAAPNRLLADGAGGFTPTSASGAPQPVTTAKIRQGALEESNVDLGHEMAQMVETQRSFQLTSSAIQTESQMMTYANQLRPA